MKRNEVKNAQQKILAVITVPTYMYMLIQYTFVLVYNVSMYIIGCGICNISFYMYVRELYESAFDVSYI